MVPDASIAFAALTLMASKAGGRPPIRPRVRLAARAVRVRSRRSPPRIAPGPRRCGGSAAQLRWWCRCSRGATADRCHVPARCPRWSEVGEWIALDDRDGGRPAHPPRGRMPRRRQAADDRLGCRSSVPRTPARTQRHGGRRSDRQCFAHRSRPAHRPTSIRSLPELVLPPSNRDEGFRTEFWDAAWPVSRRNQNQSEVLPKTVVYAIGSSNMVMRTGFVALVVTDALV